MSPLTSSQVASAATKLEALLRSEMDLLYARLERGEPVTIDDIEEALLAVCARANLREMLSPQDVLENL